MRGDNAGADETIVFVGDELDETIGGVVNFASENIGKRNEGGFEFAIATDKVVFV